MSSIQLRAELLTALQTLATGELRASATTLLEKLGYASRKTLELPTQPEAFAKEVENLLGGSKQLNAAHASLADWKSAAFLFQLTNDELPALAAGQLSLLGDSGGVQAWQVESFVFLALDLKAGTWPRTRLAALARELNRLFPMPAVLLFRHPREDGAPLLSVAVTHRRANKVDATRDVIEGKVSIIKDIDLGAPHAAHLRILESMALTAVDTKYVPHNFDMLYGAWLKVLNVKALNDRFYQDLAEWYYWAIRKSTGVVFPKGQPLEQADDPATHDRPTVALIRLLTRLIFVWFLKERRLVPAQLFDEKALGELLKAPPHQHDGLSNYYKAILQNLFFATLNTEMTEQDEDGHKQRVWREAAGPKRLDKYLIHTVYRYRSEFKDADAALALFHKVPFLNGGLFECLDKLVTSQDLERDPELAKLVVKEGNQTVLRVDGFSERPENPLHIPNELFFGEGSDEVDLNEVFGTKNRKYKPRGLLKIFDSYKFTIEENTPVEEEVALDPELLGKVFENLLASYNPDTKTTARKKSGSFYTPREVVDYMVDEALASHLERALPSVNRSSSAISSGSTSTGNHLLDLDAGDGDLDFGSDAGITSQSAPAETVTANPLPDRLRRLLSFRQTAHDFSPDEAEKLIAAIERLRVLDPACGSGAFPMGMLQKLVAVLRKLDPDNTLWKAQNRAPLAEQLASAKKVKDPTLRDEHTTAALAALAKFDADFADPDYADYARKLYLIEKCLYGVDIQPIAVQIAKLRFFISLVVEQKLGTDHQRLTPLPNLETKIVAANTLLPIPRGGGGQQDLLANPEVAEKEAELREANASHFAAKRFADKRKRKACILRLRDELAALLKAELTLKPGDAEQMTAWDPFDQNRHAEFFDPEWMFGFQQGFDIVIGNPPYVRQEAIKDDKPRLKPHYATYSGTADLYVYFYERSFQLLNPGGCLSFITSNRWFRAKYGSPLRQYMATHTELRQIIDFGDEDVFDALAYPTIVIATKRDKPVSLIEAKNDVWVLNWDSSNPDYQVSDFPDVFASERFSLPQSELKLDGWQLEPPTKRRMLEKLRKAGKPLGEYCGGRFYRGVLTGLNAAFVISREQRDALVTDDPKSSEIIKPFLRGRDVKRWNAEAQDLWLIFTRRGIAIEDYPAIKRHLIAFKTELQPKPENWDDQKQGAWPGRKAGPYEWFNIQDNIAYWKEFEATKIIYPDIYLHQSFAWDTKQHYLANTCYFIPTTERWLTALLNSSVIEWFYEQVANRIQGGYLRAFSDRMQLVPIPSTDKFQQEMIERIMSAVEAGIHAPEYERLLNGLVYELFFPEELHAKDIRLFDACKAIRLDELNLPENTLDSTNKIWTLALDAFAREISQPNKKGLFHYLGEVVFHPRHTIYGMLFELQTLEVVRLIENQH